MLPPVEKLEKCRIVAVRRDGTEVVLITNLAKETAEAIRTELIEPRAFTEIRIEFAA